MKQFYFATIKDPERKNWRRVKREMVQSVLPALADQGGRLYGLWGGLFGLASNEVILITLWEPEQDPQAPLAEALRPNGLALVRQPGGVAELQGLPTPGS